MSRHFWLLLTLASLAIQGSARAQTPKAPAKQDALGDLPVDDEIRQLEEALSSGKPAPKTDVKTETKTEKKADAKAEDALPPADEAPKEAKKEEKPATDEKKKDEKVVENKDSAEKKADETKAAKADEAKPEAAPAVPPADEVPEEIRAMENPQPQQPKAKIDETGNPDISGAYYEPQEPGGSLKPSDRFDRIPLRPRMSDSNWRRWAGRMLDKTYRIRRNDTLWGISERLFGNPYLWPKVWQLNAQIENPHVIAKGIELLFSPGNPNSAPALAFKKQAPGVSSEEMPIMSTGHKMSLLEMLDETLRAQIQSSHPPFQYFFLDDKPEQVATVPIPENHNRTYHDEGDGFMTDLDDGEYRIVHVRPLLNRFFKGYRVRWIGVVQVTHRRAIITKSFSEIQKGDSIVSRKFALSPLALHEARLGAEDRDETKIVPLQEGYETLASGNMLVGLRFAGADRGPRAGALMTLSQGPKKVATLLVIDRDRTLGTAWVVESLREIDSNTDRLD